MNIMFISGNASTYRRIQRFGLEKRYDTDELQHQLKLLVAVAFVPVEYVVRAFEVVLDEKMISDEGKPIVDYFEDTWIGRLERRERRRPLFEHGLWNFYQQTLEGKQKTNNLVEGWHRSLINQFHGKNPSIWKFIEGLMREQSMPELKLNQQLSGQQSRSNSKRKTENRRLLLLVANFYSDFQDTQEFFISYLKGVASAI